MSTKNAKEIWRLRFLKILQLEEESFEFYKKLLEEKDRLLEESGAKPRLKQILRDEGRHIQIAKRLLHLAGGEPPQRCS